MTMIRYPGLKSYNMIIVGLILQVETGKDPQQAVVTGHRS
jgi:hypothetical protein